MARPNKLKAGLSGKKALEQPLRKIIEDHETAKKRPPG